jgi:hypothetical protein
MNSEQTKHIIALVVIVGFLTIIGCWFVFPLKGDPQIFIQMLGTLGSGGFMVVIAYYFGSSAGSKAKDDALVDIAKMPVVPSEAPKA